MRKEVLDLVRALSGQYGLPARGGNNGGNQAAKPRCPNDLYSLFRSYKPAFGSFINPPVGVGVFEKVRWWEDTREWVGVYTINVNQYNDPRRCWTERFVIARRHGVMTCIKQWNGPGIPWRPHLA